MLVCPECQFENPNSHRFCQQCGLSLTDKPCSGCGASISFATQICPHCGTSTGSLWYALIAEHHGVATEEPEEKKVLSDVGQYLDAGRRYHLLSAEDNETALQLLTTNSTSRVFQGMVIDCQPLQKSVLSVLLAQQSELEGDDFLQTGQDDRVNAEFWRNIGIPDLALPYFTLKELTGIVPPVHDAWQEENKEVLLLSDRRHWQPLSDLLTTETLPLLQLLYWLNQLLTLWTALEKVNSCQSLLIASNLRLDEDQSLGLQQLYADSSENPPTLQVFATMWSNWLEKAPNNGCQPLKDLLHQVIQGKITTVLELQSSLKSLAENQQLPTESSEEDANALQPSPELTSQETLEMLEHTVLFESEDDSIASGPQEPLEDEGEGDDLPTAVLPMQLLSIDDAGCTDTGRQRRHNEDYFGMDTSVHQQQSNHGKKVQAHGLYIVCDGMGGHAGGEVASALAVNTLKDYLKTHWKDELPSQETVLKGILLANETIYNVNQDNASSGSGRMGTTLVVILIQDTDAIIAHVGDSRIYRVNRKWGLEQLTVDHEVGQRAIQNGVDPDIAYARPDAYQLTQALGPHANNYIQPDIRFLHLQEDTLFLLCSDGLSDNDLVESHWETHLQPLISASQNLERGLHKLIQLANKKNGHDNITGVLVRVKVRPEITDTW